MVAIGRLPGAEAGEHFEPVGISDGCGIQSRSPPKKVAKMLDDARAGTPKSSAICCWISDTDSCSSRTSRAGAQSSSGYRITSPADRCFMLVMRVYVLSGEAVGNGVAGAVRHGATTDIRIGHGTARVIGATPVAPLAGHTREARPDQPHERHHDTHLAPHPARGTARRSRGRRHPGSRSITSPRVPGSSNSLSGFPRAGCCRSTAIPARHGYTS